MIAEVTHKLNQALLGGGIGQSLTLPAAQQALACQTQDGIIFGGWPVKVALLDTLLHGLAFAFDGADPEPGQHDVYRQICCARATNQRLSMFEARRTESAVPRPEFVRVD